MFTKTERTILNALPKKYKYIFRTRGGNLRISERFDGIDDYLPIPVFNHLFKNVMADGEPVRFREPILDNTEREYLKTVFKPFANKIVYVLKSTRFVSEKKQFIRAYLNDDDMMTFPDFESGTMYKGMEPYRKYTLADLGITYD